MKNYAAVIPALLGVLLLLGGCADVLNPPPSRDDPAPIAGGKGRLTVSVDGAARTALPSGGFDSYKLRFNYTGDEGYTHADVDWSAGLTVDLELGNWTITAEAYAGSVLSGTGSAEVEVIAGMTTPVTIRITTINTDAGPGTLAYTVNYPADDADHTYAGKLIIKKPDGTTVESGISVSRGVAGTESLPAGVYFVTALVEGSVNDVQRTQAARTVSVHIYGGLETELTMDFPAEEFETVVPVTGTADYSFATADPTPAVSSRVIRAYSDLACTSLSLVGESAALGGSGEFVLMIPSSCATVYLRQEIVIEGQGFAGKKQEVTIPANQSEPYSITGPIDTFYKVSLPAGINGSAAGTSYAAVGTEVTLTAAAGFVLRGSPKVNDGAVTVTGSGPYTFTMPEADVTVTGDLVSTSPFRYVTEGGTGDGLSWAASSGDIQKMMDELAYLYSTDDYTGPFVVNVGAGTYKPQYAPGPDGSSVTPGDSLTDRDKTFILRTGVEVRGGYRAAGEDIDETTRKARFNAYGVPSSEDYRAILSGDFDGNDSVSGSGSTLAITGNTENAHHVVLGVNIPAGGTVLDGLTISGGCADGNGADKIPTQGNGGTSRNIERNHGGGMYNHNSSPALANVTISGNTASNSGGMFNESSSPMLTNVTISHNDGNNGYGGGMFNYSGSSPVLTDVTIFGNKASFGGGMFSNSGSSPVLTDVTISGNKALYGGGIENSSSSSVLTNVTISDNESSYGGGMYNEFESSPVLINVTISGNTATSQYGGGISSYRSSPILINVLIAGNRAYDNSAGGGIYSSSSSPTLINVTIAGNKANSGQAGGMYNEGSPPNENSPPFVIKNSIIWGNTAGDSPSGIYNDNSTPEISYSIVEGSSDTSPTGSPFTDWKDPSSITMPNSTGTYTLNDTAGDGALAINAGNNGDYPANAAAVETLLPSGATLSNTAKDAINAALEKDLAGNTRKNGVIDMGAYEH